MNEYMGTKSTVEKCLRYQPVLEAKVQQTTLPTEYFMVGYVILHIERSKFEGLKGKS